jgi:hypothetical protein
VRSLALLRGVQQPVSVPDGSRGLYVANASFLEYNRTTAAANGFIAASVLIGFDHSPTIQNFDAIIPPYSEATIAIPPGTTTLFFLYPNDTASKVTFGSSSTTLPILYDVLDCPVTPSIQAITPPLPVLGSSAFPLRFWQDLNARIFPPQLPPPILDQELRGGSFGNGFLRPPIAPSGTDIVRAVTAANTIFNFNGANFLTTYSVATPFTSVIKRIYVSVSADCLLVIGTNGLTVGAPGANEVWRGKLKAVVVAG